MGLFKEVLEDVDGSLSKGNGNGNFTNLLFKSIKNLMSDCCATDKKFNNLFTKFRKELLPDVIKNWENLPNDQQKSLGNVIDFFCGLHFLVGLADQAEPYLKVWENINFTGQNVGSLLHESYSNGELGTLRLLRTVCKSVQHHAYEKSGRMVTCEIFMEKRNITRLPIYQFLGNRFNILFLIGASVYFLFDNFINFFDQMELDSRLLVAVYWDLKVLAFRVGYRVLGLIEKLVTGPLWRIMVKEKCVLNMSTHYQNLLTCFEKWADDCTSFLNNETSCEPSFISQDDCFNSLHKPVSEEIHIMTKQCLEIIFGRLVIVTRRILHDHLKEGKYSTKIPLLEKDASFLNTANAVHERDFGLLDRLMRIKPKALDFVYEGLIVSSKSKTNLWRDQLSKEQLEMAMESARRSKQKRKELYIHREK